MESQSKGRSSLFRQEALEHLLKEEEIREPFRVSPPWTWSIMIMVGVVVLVAIAAAFVARIDVRSSSRGALRPVGGVRLIQANEGGTLLSLAVKSGDPMSKAQVLATLENYQQHGRNVKVSDTKVSGTKASGQERLALAAPEDGVVESVECRPGDLLQPGQTVFRFVSAQDRLQVVAFLLEKDATYVKEGDLVAIELDAYPYTEYGALKAKVSRVGVGPVSLRELQETLGEAQERREGAMHRIEMDLLPPTRRLAGVQLRSGMMLQARFTLRRERLLSMVLDPLKRWLE